ncbi:hypothetical protein [uncultured Zhongshania sp.]|uniref:hypothetical protein n=1 Tax=uncultured Zhongshania sp. TaxID=1642288 RepID=UPI0025D99D94|nr:hypothetical protein [uncultured Zhongshania sp.]
MNNQPVAKPIVSDKPFAIPIEMRPLWRISLLVASIATAGGEKRYLSVKKANMLVWMLIRQKRWDEYEDYLNGRSQDLPLVSTDTATYKAVELALAKGLIKLESGRLHVSESGIELYHLLVENDIMANEMSFLKDVGKKLTDNKVKAITEGLI